MANKGLFITFEGADGSGKTTQLEKIAEHLANEKFSIIKTREPGATELGQKIRNLVLHYDGDVSPTCEMFLFLSDRAQHIDTLIKPALEDGKIVLCDRHIDSTIAYQGYGRGKDIEQLKNLNKIATSSMVPDLTLVYDVDTDVAQTRVGDEKDRLEAAGAEFHKKVRHGYLELAKEYPDRIIVINANNSIDTVYNETKNIIIDLITQKSIQKGE